jgi:hypothetical protein
MIDTTQIKNWTFEANTILFMLIFLIFQSNILPKILFSQLSPFSKVSKY